MNIKLISLVTIFVGVTFLRLSYGQEIQKEYYDNGNLKTEWGNKDGKKHGWAKVYFPDGVLESVMMYENGRRNGQAKKYYKNATL